jgi:hypothetical protein
MWRIKVGSKAFLFVRADNAMIKVDGSQAEAARLAFKDPAATAWGPAGG